VPTQIGRERVDRTFLQNLDNGNLQLFQGASDPRSTRVYFAYKSLAGKAANFDTLLGYDYVLDRWFTVSISGQYLLGISQSGLTLQSLDPIAPGAMAITAMANNGAGLIRVTVASTASLASGSDVAIDNATGTVEANGWWKIAVINATQFDLISNNVSGAASAFVNAYTGGGLVAGSVDAMTLSLDSYATAVQPQLAAFSAPTCWDFSRARTCRPSCRVQSRAPMASASRCAAFARSPTRRRCSARCPIATPRRRRRSRARKWP